MYLVGYKPDQICALVCKKGWKNLNVFDNVGNLMCFSMRSSYFQLRCRRIINSGSIFFVTLKKKKVQMYDYVCYVASINSLVPKILTKNDENSLLCNITLNGIMTGLDTNQQHILF